MIRRIGLAAAAVVVLGASGSTAALAQDPGICDDTLEPQMQKYQFFDDDTQAVIDSLGPCDRD